MARFICTALSAVAQAGLFSLFLGSCAAVTQDNPEIYRVGELEVRLYKDQGRLAQELPLLLSSVEALRIGGKQMKVLGYFDRQKKRIYSIDDPRVLLHELKHYLEPDWRHDIGCAHLTALDEQAGSSSRQRPFSECVRANTQSFDFLTDPPLEPQAGEDSGLGS